MLWFFVEASSFLSIYSLKATAIMNLNDLPDKEKRGQSAPDTEVDRLQKNLQFIEMQIMSTEDGAKTLKAASHFLRYTSI